MARGKKRFLGFCVITGAVATAAMVMVNKGDYFLCSLLYIIANFLWCAGNIFYDGFLPELTDDPERMDEISATGFGIGYLGGGIALAICAGLIFGKDLIGIDEKYAYRIIWLIVAVWWVIFTIPLLKNVHEKGEVSTVIKGFGYVYAGFSRFSRTMVNIRKLPNLCRMLLAYLLYNAGIGTIQYIASGYVESELNIPLSVIVGVFLMIQILGFPAAFAYIKFARKVGTRTSILVGLSVFIIVVIFAMQMTTAIELWILGVLVALVQGGAQAMSRSLYGSMIPENMNAEFFGFFSVFNKVGSFFGPLLFGVVKDMTGSSRQAVLSLVIFFILGFIALLTVRVEKGRAEAMTFRAS